MIRIKKYVYVILATLLMLFVAACGDENQVDNSNTDEGVVSMGTYPVGIAFHSAGSGVSKVVSDNSDIKMIVNPFASTTAWMPQLNRGELETGILSKPDMEWAFTGKQQFDEPNKNLRTLVKGNDIVVSGFTVREDSGIESISDLKGKTIAYNFGGASVMPLIFEIQLKSVGLTIDDVETLSVADIGEGLSALRENRVDATFTGDPSVSSFLEADNAIGIRALNYGDLDPEDIDTVPEEDLEEMQEILPGLEVTTYQGGFVDEETILLKYPIALGASKELTDGQAYQIVETLWGNYEELHPIFNWLETWEPDIMFDEDPSAPYHPGVVKFFEEEGLWTEDLEEKQNDLLEKAN